jgi:hypothetical protein
MSAVKLVSKRKAKKDEFDSVDLSKVGEWVTEHPVGYEALIGGGYIPYYEFDAKFKTQKEQEANYRQSLTDAFNSVSEKFPDATIYSFDASGYDPVAKVWKNSHHFRVRGSGYFKSGLDIPKIEGADDAVYKKPASRQLMRLPFCTKSGNQRPLLRVQPDVDPDKKYTQAGIKELNESITDYLIQNAGGEELVPDKPKENVEPPLPKPERKAIDTLVRKGNILLNDVTAERVDKLCSCLADNRFDDRVQWLRVMRALKTIARTHLSTTMEEVIKIAHKHSSRSDKYDVAEVDGYFNRHDPVVAFPLNIGSLVYWAREDNLRQFSELESNVTERKKGKYNRLIDQALAQPRRYTFADYTAFVNTTIKDEFEVIKYLTDTVIHIIDGGRHKIFTRNVNHDGTTEFILVPVTLFSDTADFMLRFDSGEKSLMSKYFQENYYHVRSFHKIDFQPYLTTDPVHRNIFNLWNGFQYEFVDALAEGDDEKINNSVQDGLDLILYHIREIICDGDEIIYEYILNHIAHMFQKPNEKPGVAVLLQSPEHGTGKNRLTDFLMAVVGTNNCYKANQMEQVCSKFNFHIQGKLLVIGDEIANYTSHKFADQLKAVITEIWKAIEPKGKDSYVIHSFERYWFTSNNDFPFRVDKGDRRLLPLRVSAAKKGDVEYFNRLSAAIDDTEVQRAFFNLMCRRDIQDWNFRAIPTTQLKSELIMEGLDNAVHFMIDYASKHRLEISTMKVGVVREHYVDWCRQNGHKEVSTRKFNKDIKNALGICKKKGTSGDRSPEYTLNKKDIEQAVRTLLNAPKFSFDEHCSEYHSADKHPRDSTDWAKFNEDNSDDES